MTFLPKNVWTTDDQAFDNIHVAMQKFDCLERRVAHVLAVSAMLDGVSIGATGSAVGSSSVPPTLGK